MISNLCVCVVCVVCVVYVCVCVHSPLWRLHDRCEGCNSEPWFPWQLPQCNGLHLERQATNRLWYVRTHTLTPTYTHTHTHIRTHRHTCTRAKLLIRSHTTNMHGRTDTHTHKYKCTTNTRSDTGREEPKNCKCMFNNAHS